MGLSAGSVSMDKIFWFKLKTEEKGAGNKFLGASCFSCSDALVCKICLFWLFKPWVIQKHFQLVF
jgi:hypothetical protein